MVKTNRKGFCKYPIDKLTKYWAGVSYIVLNRKSTMTGDRPISYIGCKHNVRKVLYFIIALDIGIKDAIIIFLSNYNETFCDVVIQSVACILLMSKVFAYINDV